MRKRTMWAAGRAALAWKLRGRRRPVHVMLALTDRCTQRCGYCAIPERGRADPHTADLLSLVDQLAYAGTLRIGLWGGEPLLRADLPALLERCRQHGIWTSLDTNGALFRRRAPDVDHVVFSLDGQRTSHDAVRGRGTWERAVDGIAAARERRLPHWTLTVLTRHNLDDVPWLVEQAERHGHVAAFQVLHHPETLDGGRGAAHAPHPAALRDALRWLRAARRAGRPIGNSPAQLEHLLRWSEPHATTERDVGAPACVAGALYCNVDTDGRLAPCSLLPTEGPSAWDVGFRHAFDALDPPRCRSCTATCFYEYNALLGMRPSAAAWWMRALA